MSDFLDHDARHAGQQMHTLAGQLFPINRSLTGAGVRETLGIIKQQIPDLQLHEVKTASQCFDWTIPPEWNVKEAWVEDPDGRRIIDFAQHNLHLVGYSIPVDKEMELDELQTHLHSLPEQPDAIPYITSYYQERWGFCLTHNQRETLQPGKYRVKIDAELNPKGVMNYADLLLPGASKEEILLSTYICHPSMANNELSGPMVATWLAKWLQSAPRAFSYRVVFIPETIGSIQYLSRHLAHLQTHVVAGFNLTCMGDERCFSYLPSRDGNTLSDRVAKHVLGHLDPDYIRYTWMDRGSDERQYCAPGVDLPIASIMRSKFHEYPEYHTSLDDLTLVTPNGLAGGYLALRRALEVIEGNRVWRGTTICEPQMGKRGLYSTLGTRAPEAATRVRMHILSLADGNHDLIQMAERIKLPVWELLPFVQELAEHGLLEEVR
ncbi:Protein containing aminopeptidase domain [hydrothermal vent metagenome]|uniref:Protein containing aminopeptidase domain n=1 Tax=hydrothermal vent metagenome TaxID=652676 RepID=A0A3B0R5J0_9ZZZZ